MTISEASGFGRQKGHSEVYRGAEYTVDFVPKVRVEVLRRRHRRRLASSRSSSRRLPPDGSATARSGSVPVEDLARVRTGERGIDAI
jgi:nitrogen regulatory protein P-II 1